jgi:hypothetical protein
MAKRGRPPLAPGWAETILRCLEKHTGGLSMKMLLHLTGLEPGQYRRAYNWSLDTFGEPFWAKQYINGEPVYFAMEHLPAVVDDWKRTISTQITRGRREYHKAHAFNMAHPSVDREEQAMMAEFRLRQLEVAKRKLQQQA